MADHNSNSEAENALSGDDERPVLTATMKWFNPVRQFGFLRPDDGSDDLFICSEAFGVPEIGRLRGGLRVIVLEWHGGPQLGGRIADAARLIS